MQNSIYYIKYALRFADMQIPELVTVFNSQVQNRGWSSMRAYHDQALIDEFQRRGIDTSAITDGHTITREQVDIHQLTFNKRLRPNAVCSGIEAVHNNSWVKQRTNVIVS